MSRTTSSSLPPPSSASPPSVASLLSLLTGPLFTTSSPDASSQQVATHAPLTTLRGPPTSSIKPSPPPSSDRDADFVTAAAPANSSTSASLIKITPGMEATKTTTKQTSKSLEQLSTMVLDLQTSSDKAAELMSSDAAGGGGHIKALLEQSKRIVVQLQGLQMAQNGGNDFELRSSDGQLPSYDALVSKLDDAFKTQKQINILNARLLSANYMINLSNYAKNRSMQRALSWGKKQVTELQQNVASLEDTVDTLNVEVDVQKKAAGRLKDSLDSTRTMLENTMIEYRKELNRQAEVIRKQQILVGDVRRNKLNQDFIVDSGLFLFCIWFVNTFAVEYAVQGAVQVAVKGRRRQVWARQAGKAIILMFLLRRLRMGAVHYGIHNRVGSVVPYVSSFFGLLFSQFSRGLGIARPESIN